MNARGAALEADRLPWLSDEGSVGRKNDSWNGTFAWGLVAALLIAGASYAVGLRGAGDLAAPSDDVASPGEARISLPAPADIAPADRADRPEPAATPAVAAEAPARPKSAARSTVRPRPVRRPAAAEPAQATEAAAGESISESEQAARTVERLEYWPADQSAGATGRLVRIGTFSSIRQAKLGWRKIVNHHPGLASLKATVVSGKSLRNSRTYYRLQFGTTSQAHSAILCQRMRMIAQSCVVVGLSGDGG